MNYEELKELFHEYREGRMTNWQIQAAIALWQLKINGRVASWDMG